MIGSVITGAIIGAVASRIMHSRHGFFMNMIIGMAGASLGHFLFGLVGFTAHGLAGFLVEVTGACLVISLARKIG